MASSIKDVELVTVGTHAAMSGVVTINASDLQSMLAAQADGQIDHAPIKLGHVSSLNDGIGDGAPAFGWVKPTRIGPRASDGKLTLFGDLLGMPDLLAAVAPTAYRRRSGEIDWKVTGSNGKTYPAVLSAIALLGVTPPAVKGMADMVVMLGKPTSADTITIIDGLDDQPVQVAMLAAAHNAGASVAEVDAMATAAGASDTAHVPPPVEDGVNDEHVEQTPRHEENTMAVTDEQLRKLLKLEEGKDVDAEVKRLLAEHEAAAPPAATVPPVAAPGVLVTPPAAAPATPAAPVVNADGTTTPAPAAEAAPAAAPELATATLSADQHKALLADAAWAGQERRRQALDQAVAEGRISPAERGKLTSELAAGEAQVTTSFAAALERDEAGTKALLSGLTPRFATTALGHEQAPAADNAADKAYDTFESEVFGLDRTPTA